MDKKKELTEYEKYCQMMAKQQEDDMEDLLIEEELFRDDSPELHINGLCVKREYQPEGVFVRGH